MDECKPLPSIQSARPSSMAKRLMEVKWPRAMRRRRTACSEARQQGLTLVHFSAQRKRFLWDRGCIEGLFRGCSAGVWEVLGVLGGVKGAFRIRYGLG